MKNLKFDHQQVIIDINGAEHLSIVSINGKPEIAIIGPEGVYHNSVEPINNVKQLVNYLAHYFGGTTNG